MTGTADLDSDLVRAAWAGDASALGALLERHRAWLYATALSMLGDPTDAQDAVQDTLLTAVARLGDVREPAAVAGWLRTVVRNHCLMRIRPRRPTPTGDIELNGRSAFDVEETIDRLALGDWVWTAIGRLPDDQAVTVMLRYFSRHDSYQEIAAVLGIPIGTVRSRLSQAKQRLADELLRTAAGADTDHRALVEDRARWWRATVDELHGRGVGDLYAADCAPDVRRRRTRQRIPRTWHRRSPARRRRQRRRRRTNAHHSVSGPAPASPSSRAAISTLPTTRGTAQPLTPKSGPIAAGQTSRLLLYYRSHDDAVASP